MSRSASVMPASQRVMSLPLAHLRARAKAAAVSEDACRCAYAFSSPTATNKVCDNTQCAEALLPFLEAVVRLHGILMGCRAS